MEIDFLDLVRSSASVTVTISAKFQVNASHVRKSSGTAALPLKTGLRFFYKRP